MPKWIGNRFGSIVPIAPGDNAPSAVYNIFDQYYSRKDGGWIQPVSITGGTAYGPVTIDGAARFVCKFTSPGTFTLSGADTTNARILVVGGGGAGGSFNPGNYGGGGGGAGGVRYVPQISLTSGDYPVSVGDGGTGGNPWAGPDNGGTPAQPKGGGTSSIFNPGNGNSVPAITATGGGAGGVNGSAGGDGGSGGGKSYPGNGGSGGAGGTEPRANPTSEGNPAHHNKSGGNSYQCGGGGGANPNPSTLPFQKGSPGVTLPGMGSPGNPHLPPAGNVFGGGGGGSSYKETQGNGEGGPGGGGDAPAGDAEEYTGGGGGGTGTPNGQGGNGGYGVVYVIVPAADVDSANPG